MRGFGMCTILVCCSVSCRTCSHTARQVLHQFEPLHKQEGVSVPPEHLTRATDSISGFSVIGMLL